MGRPTQTLYPKNFTEQTEYSVDHSRLVTDTEMLRRVMLTEGCKASNSQQYIKAFECTIKFKHINFNNAKLSRVHIFWTRIHVMDLKDYYYCHFANIRYL